MKCGAPRSLGPLSHNSSSFRFVSIFKMTTVSTTVKIVVAMVVVAALVATRFSSSQEVGTSCLARERCIRNECRTSERGRRQKATCLSRTALDDNVHCILASLLDSASCRVTRFVLFIVLANLAYYRPFILLSPRGVLRDPETFSSEVSSSLVARVSLTPRVT